MISREDIRDAFDTVWDINHDGTPRSASINYCELSQASSLTIRVCPNGHRDFDHMYYFNVYFNPNPPKGEPDHFYMEFENGNMVCKRYDDMADMLGAVWDAGRTHGEKNEAQQV